MYSLFRVSSFLKILGILVSIITIIIPATNIYHFLITIILSVLSSFSAIHSFCFKIIFKTRSSAHRFFWRQKDLQTKVNKSEDSFCMFFSHFTFLFCFSIYVFIVHCILSEHLDILYSEVLRHWFLFFLHFSHIFN